MSSPSLFQLERFRKLFQANPAAWLTRRELWERCGDALSPHDVKEIVEALRPELDTRQGDRGAELFRMRGVEPPPPPPPPEVSPDTSAPADVSQAAAQEPAATAPPDAAAAPPATSLDDLFAAADPTTSAELARGETVNGG